MDLIAMTNTNTPSILAAGRIVNGKGVLSNVMNMEQALRNGGCIMDHLYIDPLKKGWKTPVGKNHYRSGCAPIEALECACEKIEHDLCDAVVIEGVDNIKTDFGGRRLERLQLMNIYGDDCPLPEAYTKLAFEFIKIVGITPEVFRKISEKLYENYQHTAEKEKIITQPDPRRFKYVTELFRAVDCANPSVDFNGRLIVGNKKARDVISTKRDQRVYIRSVAVEELKDDGPAFAREIASYDHLKKAYNDACSNAGIPFREKYLEGQALLETYTCYPVVPMAFLLSSNIASSFNEIENILAHYEITVTGGMNIGRAAWNNPALNGLICVYDKLCKGEAKWGMVHGNGGLGYKQGIVLLEAG